MDETLKLTPFRKRILKIITTKESYVLKTREERFYLFWQEGRTKKKMSVTRFADALIHIFSDFTKCERDGDYELNFRSHTFEEWADDNGLEYKTVNYKYKIKGVHY